MNGAIALPRGSSGFRQAQKTSRNITIAEHSDLFILAFYLKRNSHKEAQKAYKTSKLNFVTCVPFCGRSFPVPNLLEQLLDRRAHICGRGGGNVFEAASKRIIVPDSRVVDSERGIDCR